MIKLKSLLLEIEDYRGLYTAPTKDIGASLDNITAIYPDDIYSNNAVRYYGTGEDLLDRQSLSIIQQAKGRPNLQVKIYRAVPLIITNQDKINYLEKQKKYILKYGKVPSTMNTKLDRSDYYDKISNELDRLKALPPEDTKKIEINKEDWVTINKQYAKDHGEATLLGKYRILTKIVPAKTLFTNGDSIHEWGYDP